MVFLVELPVQDKLSLGNSLRTIWVALEDLDPTHLLVVLLEEVVHLVGAAQPQEEDLVLLRVDLALEASVEHRRVLLASEEPAQTLDSVASANSHKVHRQASPLEEEDSSVVKASQLASAQAPRVLRVCRLVVRAARLQRRLRVSAIKEASEGKALVLDKLQHQACLDSLEQVNLVLNLLLLLGLKVELEQVELNSLPSPAPSHPNSRFSASTVNSPHKPCLKKTPKEEEGRISDSTTFVQTTSSLQLPLRCCGCMTS